MENVVTTSPVTTYERLPRRASHARQVLLVLPVAILIVAMLIASVCYSGSDIATLKQQFELLKVALTSSVGLELILIMLLMRKRAVFSVGLFTLAIAGFGLYLLGSF